MKNFYLLPPKLIFACIVFFGNISFAADENNDLFDLDQNEVLSIRKELEVISAELSDLENIFIYENKDTLARGASLDIFLRLSRLENRLASAIGFLENLENRFEKTTRVLIFKLTEIEQLMNEIVGKKSTSGTLIELYDDVAKSTELKDQEFRQLPEDQREYLSVKAIFDGGNYELAVEEFSSFLERFSGSKLSLQVKFWRSESYLRLKNWPSAAEGFLEVFSADSNGALSVYSLFGLVLSLSELGEKEQSCSALLEIKNRNALKFNEFQEQLINYGKNLNCDFEE